MTGFSIGVGLLITLVGVPILVGNAARGPRARLRSTGRARTRCSMLDVVRAAAPGRPDDGLPAAARRPFRDGANWKASVYLVLMLPLGIVNFSVAVTIWSAALSALFLPRLRVGAAPRRGRALAGLLPAPWLAARPRLAGRAPAHARGALDHPPLRPPRRGPRPGAPRRLGQGRADRAAAGDARPLGRRGRRGAPPDRARPARRRAAAARAARDGSRARAREVRRRPRRARAGSSARLTARPSARSSSCATWCAASTRRCSRTAASTPRSRRSRPARPSRSRSRSTCRNGRRRRSRPTPTSSSPRR